MPENTWCDPLQMMQIVLLLNNDSEPKGAADAAYLFGHTEDFEGPILDAGIDLYHVGATYRLCFCKLAPGYPHSLDASGKCLYRDEKWSGILSDAVTRDDILVPIESPRPNSPGEKFPVSHTGTEAERFVKLCREKNWDNVYIVAHPIHVVRAFAATVGWTLKLYPELKVYAKTTCGPLPWYKTVVANQGAKESNMLDAVAAEWKRLCAVYGNEYDLPSYDTVMAYHAMRHGGGEQ